ncbi:HEPN domain-containing protein [Alteromonas australica]|uniref:Uncharacterized protein n=1 Tax=Alteromonas australica TaxID=589873 RepID=A0A075NRZ4_9ALTE|nr:HEPN domain-containing protein [Alteromonas australica]AIF97274.1 hypothetical protein EP13_00410 [Alteromonas australica]
MSANEFVTTEYLVILEKSSVGALFNFIKSGNDLNQLIQNESSLIIQSNKLHSGNLKLDYKIRCGSVSGKAQRYFYISVKGKNNELLQYTKSLRELKKALGEQNFIIETLQDDVSFYYSRKAYSIIHEIENLMRKFITFFMIAKVGKDWVSDNLPSQVKSALKKTKPRKYSSELQKLDFKDLGFILFDTYQLADNTSLYNKIKSYKSSDEILLSDLKNFIPRSNWDHFFSEQVEIEGPTLKSKWERLYELRNSVAHTSYLSSDKYEEIRDLVSELKPTLERAFERLGKLQLDTSERLAISDRVATTLDARVGAYFSDINYLEKEIRALLPNAHEMPLAELIDELVRKGEIENYTGEKIRKLIHLRGSVSFNSITSKENINELASQLHDVQSQIQKSWSKEVYFALKALGGRSQLDKIYTQVEKQTNRRLFGSWRTSVRRAIYFHSSDVELFNGKYDIYKQISKGVWMIRKSIDPTMLREFLGGEDAKN